MTTPEQELKFRYEQLSDDVLLDLWRQNTLTDTAKQILRVELQQRGIAVPEQQSMEAVEDSDELEGGPVEFQNDGKWVTVAQFSLPTEAHIFRARLEAENIPAYVADEHQVNANWLWSIALGGAKVRVPESCAERAYAILRSLEDGEFDLGNHRD